MADFAVSLLLVANALYFLYMVGRRWVKDRAAAAAAQAVAPVTTAAPPDDAPPRWMTRGGIVLVLLAAVGAAFVLTPALTTMRRDVSRPLRTWISAPVLGRDEPLRYQWLQLGAGDDGRVPVLDCAQWSPDWALALQVAVLAPIPPLSPEALDDAERHEEELDAQAAMRKAREKATRRCFVHPETLLPWPDPNQDHLLQRERLSRWVPSAHAAAELAAGNRSVKHVAILRNGTRFYPAAGVRATRVPSTKEGAPPQLRWTYGEALLSEEALLQVATAWITRQQEHSNYGLKQNALDRCLCLPYVGVFGSALQLFFDLRTERWHLWQQAKVARVVTRGCEGDGCVGNQTYGQTKASPWPDTLVRPMLDAGPLAHGGVADVPHFASFVVQHYDLVEQVDALVDLHVNLLEPGWQDASLGADDVSGVAAVIEVERLVPSGPRETPPLEHKDALCVAHCLALEEALCVVK